MHSVIHSLYFLSALHECPSWPGHIRRLQLSVWTGRQLVLDVLILCERSKPILMDNSLVDENVLRTVFRNYEASERGLRVFQSCCATAVETR